MILDTTVLLDLMRNSHDVHTKVTSLENDGIPLRVSVMTVNELYYGIGATDTSAAEKRKVDAVLGSKPVYDVTPEIGRKSGRLAGELEKRGQPINDVGDEIIAATGIVHDEPVLTRNTKHFDRFDDLEVESY
jgi:tRNA(fMet)-specific endonuclease VapC